MSRWQLGSDAVGFRVVEWGDGYAELWVMLETVEFMVEFNKQNIVYRGRIKGTDWSTYWIK